MLYVMYNARCFLNGIRKRIGQTRRSTLAWILKRHRESLLNPDLILRNDRVIGSEQRWHAIGRIRNAVLLVVHAYLEEKPNGEETIRIISAREANPRERRVYLEQTAD